MKGIKTLYNRNFTTFQHPFFKNKKYIAFVEILGIFSLYHSFPVLFFPILRMVITLYIYSVHERMKELMKKLPFINLKIFHYVRDTMQNH